ncbi:uncharacterized protein LACBIDRAFT_300910 [Laccaria bicolor S238N-H82]|uniref:Predicted protein n=1 Tax=Laccaria bicolor (strain S238N-H82 / ATCC MYA-4686) TaxID=486041 RepID=B0CQV3_LACBS|nr:uncharacterized protein LACBIDRAFT_300910 [Laccaria bicolor S238N-H82]EDR15098.1 predicted protein [Laccaria bicolor S238N-H82]|eukprot:XP_001873306.1 predicted protein [Laccaria bicolor S238N-H82]
MKTSSFIVALTLGLFVTATPGPIMNGRQISEARRGGKNPGKGRQAGVRIKWFRNLRVAAHKIIFIRLRPVVPPLAPPLPKLPLKIRLQLLEEILETTEEILRLPSVRTIQSQLLIPTYLERYQALDPKVIATGFANNGQDVPEAGQVASLTSSNNFINFCLTVPNLPITNGKQITTGSCNPAPMGVIPSSDNMPSAKFTFPKNGDTIKATTAFTISMAVKNFQTGAFVNAQENYFAAPQQVNGQGQIIGHSHVVVEQLTALDQTTPTDPKTFAFFKGLNAAAQNGILTADVTNGLPSGFYKLSSINTAANHQPVLVPIAQHGSLDDAVYFTITDNGQPAANAAVASVSATTASTTSAASSKTSTGTPPPANGGRGGGRGGKGRRMIARSDSARAL